MGFSANIRIGEHISAYNKVIGERCNSLTRNGSLNRARENGGHHTSIPIELITLQDLYERRFTNEELEKLVDHQWYSYLDI